VESSTLKSSFTRRIVIKDYALADIGQKRSPEGIDTRSWTNQPQSCLRSDSATIRHYQGGTRLEFIASLRLPNMSCRQTRMPLQLCCRLLYRYLCLHARRPVRGYLLTKDNIFLLSLGVAGSYDSRGLHMLEPRESLLEMIECTLASKFVLRQKSSTTSALTKLHHLCSTVTHQAEPLYRYTERGCAGSEATVLLLPT
jgi:hypothetical protein